MSSMINSVRSFVKGEEGATMVEYGLMVALIAVACIASITSLSGKLSSLFTSVGTDL